MTEYKIIDVPAETLSGVNVVLSPAYSYIEKIADDGSIHQIPINLENSDYTQYLKWLEDNK